MLGWLMRKDENHENPRTVVLPATMKTVEVEELPDGAVLQHWTCSVCACYQYGFSEACHVHLYVHDHSAAADSERRAVCSLIDF